MILSVAAFCTCALGAGENDGKTSPDPVGVVQKYVGAHKSWKTSDYKISEDHKGNGFIVYLVFYLPDKKMGYPGGGESFLAYYDPKISAVAKEMRFQ